MAQLLGEPITRDGLTRYGELIDCGDNKQVLSTYTAADGMAELRMSHDPGIVEQVRHWLGVNSPAVVPL